MSLIAVPGVAWMDDSGTRRDKRLSSSAIRGWKLYVDNTYTTLLVDGNYNDKGRQGRNVLYFPASGNRVEVFCEDHRIKGKCTFHYAGNSQPPETFEDKVFDIKSGNWGGEKYMKEVEDILLEAAKKSSCEVKIKVIVVDFDGQPAPNVTISLELTIGGSADPPIPPIALKANVVHKHALRQRVDAHLEQGGIQARISVSGQGFYPQNLAIPIVSSAEQTVKLIVLRNKEQTKKISAKGGVAEFTQDSSSRQVHSVQLNEVLLENGSLYEGEVEVMAVLTDTDSLESLDQFPSFTGRGLPSGEGEDVQLESGGAIRLELKAANGSKIDKAKVLVRIPGNKVLAALGHNPETIPFWCLKGDIWIYVCEAGFEAEKSAYIGELTLEQSSFTNLDYPMSFRPLPQFRFRGKLTFAGTDVPVGGAEIKCHQVGVATISKQSMSSSNGEFILNLVPNKEMRFTIKYDDFSCGREHVAESRGQGGCWSEGSETRCITHTVAFPSEAAAQAGESSSTCTIIQLPFTHRVVRGKVVIVAGNNTDANDFDVSACKPVSHALVVIEQRLPHCTYTTTATSNEHGEYQKDVFYRGDICVKEAQVTVKLKNAQDIVCKSKTPSPLHRLPAHPSPPPPPPFEINVGLVMQVVTPMGAGWVDETYVNANIIKVVMESWGAVGYFDITSIKQKD